MDALDSFRSEISDCRKCGLCRTRTHVVFGEGNPKAEIVFVGEAPGRNEDLENRPFVGAAGKLLSRLLGGIGLDRKDVYIANVIKCRPPENRNPSREEIESCLPFLWRQIEIIRPRVVCTLGNFAAQALLGRKVAIMKVRGIHEQINTFFVYPMLHPAAALHQGGLRKSLEEDFADLRRFLQTGPEPAARPELSNPDQMGLL